MTGDSPREDDLNFDDDDEFVLDDDLNLESRGTDPDALHERLERSILEREIGPDQDWTDAEPPSVDASAADEQPEAQSAEATPQQEREEAFDDDDLFALEDDEDEVFAEEQPADAPTVDAQADASSCEEPESSIDESDLVFGDLDEGEFFVLDEQQEQSEQPSDTEDAILFATQEVAAQEVFGEGKEFAEQGDGWDGQSTNLSELGIEPDQEDAVPQFGMDSVQEEESVAGFEMEEQELELVDSDAELDTPLSEEAPLSHETELELESRVAYEDEPEPEEGWEPVDEFDAEEAGEQPVEGHEYYEDEPVAVGAEGEDYGDLDEQYVDEHDESGVVVGSVTQGRFGGWRTVAGIAAAVLIAGVAALAWFKPEILGMKSEQPDQVQVIHVDRPDAGSKVKTPKVDVPGSKVKKPDIVKQPDVPQVPKVPENPENPAGQGDTKTPVGQGVEVVKRPDQAQPKAPTVQPVKQPDVEVLSKRPADVVEAREVEGEIGDIPLGPNGVFMRGSKEPKKNKVVSFAGVGINKGGQALAQLHNNEIFVGRVKAADADVVTLNLERGEVTLSMASIRVLTPLAQHEFEKLRRDGRAAFIYLRNDNRLRGVVVERRDDSITVQVASNRVIIPREAIDQIRTIGQQRIQFGEDDGVDSEEAWLKKLVEKKLRNRRARAPVGGGNDAKPKRPAVRFDSTGIGAPKPQK